MLLTFPAPDPREGHRLRDAIRAAGHPTADVVLLGDQWQVSADSELDQARVRQLVEAHDGTPQPPPPSPARRRLREATTVAQLRDAVDELLGPSS